MRYWFDCEFDEDGETIILISIAFVSEDNRELLCISNEFDPERPNDWVKKNVLPHLPPRTDKRWMSKEQIKHKVLEFFAGDKDPEIWADYGAYDWVVFSQLFGKMIDKPKKFPFNHMDTKQWWKQLGEPELPKQVGTEHDALDDAKHSRAKWTALKNYATRMKESANHFCQVDECFMPATKEKAVTGFQMIDGKLVEGMINIDAKLCLKHGGSLEGGNQGISMESRTEG
jgi:hypothetical protein